LLTNKRLKADGISVLRFWEHELNDWDRCLKRLRQTLGAKTAPHRTTHKVPASA
jgi:very-short-patch-repair endonuclease